MNLESGLVILIKKEIEKFVVYCVGLIGYLMVNLGFRLILLFFVMSILVFVGECVFVILLGISEVILLG